MANIKPIARKHVAKKKSPKSRHPKWVLKLRGIVMVVFSIIMLMCIAGMLIKLYRLISNHW